MIRFSLTAMGRVVALTLLAIAVAPLYAAPQHLRPQAKKSPSTSSNKSASAVVPRRGVISTRPVARISTRTSLRVAASGSTASRTPRNVRGRGRYARAVHTPPPPSYQLHPDPDRYQVIQKALADRGYFKGEPNGEWGDDSTDAMRRFQADQKIDNEGKIDALSLIALGLGPKHDGSTASEPRLPPVTSTSESASPLQASAPSAAASGQPR